VFIMAYTLHARRSYSGQASAASGLDVLAGIWLLISPFVLHFRGYSSLITNDVVLGIVIGILALIRFFSPSRGTVWASWVNVVLGIWVLISPWCLAYSAYRPAMTNNVIMGIIVIILGLWSASASMMSDNSAAVTATLPSDRVGPGPGTGV
jgi:hypothetical protein